VKQIGIVGLGLIGGSLGLALRGLGARVEVTGVDQRASTADRARNSGAVDRAGTDLRLLADCQLVVVAVPISAIQRVLVDLEHLLPAQTLITDVASVKEAVLEWAGDLKDPARFLGGHPMTGKVEHGLDSSDPWLFSEAAWLFTPREGQDLGPFTPWLDLVRAIGSRPRLMPAEVHDRQAALLSHLAFTVSSAYAATVSGSDTGMAGPGFRGMVRLASGDPDLYRDIAMTNRGPLLAAIDNFVMVLSSFRRGIDEGDQDQLRELFIRAGHVAG
jgi:prephenate dehydrogenase